MDHNSPRGRLVSSHAMEEQLMTLLNADVDAMQGSVAFQDANQLIQQQQQRQRMGAPQNQQNWMTVLQQYQASAQAETVGHSNAGECPRFTMDNSMPDGRLVQLTLGNIQSQMAISSNQHFQVSTPGGNNQTFMLVPAPSSVGYNFQPEPQTEKPLPYVETTVVRRNSSTQEDSKGGCRKRTSSFRGVTKHRRSGRWEAHIWVKETGKQVYLGGYEHEEHAAEAYDVAAIKCKGKKVKTNFPLSKYTELMAFMENITLEELVMAVRRQSQGFARGSSSYRGVTHHPNGRWEARIGMPGSKHIYLGLYNDESDAARAYDRALVRLRGPVAATNFSLAEYKDELQEYHQRQQDELQAEKMQAILGQEDEHARVDDPAALHPSSQVDIKMRFEEPPATRQGYDHAHVDACTPEGCNEGLLNGGYQDSRTQHEESCHDSEKIVSKEEPKLENNQQKCVTPSGDETKGADSLPVPNKSDIGTSGTSLGEKTSVCGGDIATIAAAQV